MTDAEKQILHDAVRELADKYLPLVVADVVAKIPAPYGTIAQSLLAAVQAELMAKLDAAIDSAI